MPRHPSIFCLHGVAHPLGSTELDVIGACHLCRADLGVLPAAPDEKTLGSWATTTLLERYGVAGVWPNPLGEPILERYCGSWATTTLRNAVAGVAEHRGRDAAIERSVPPVLYNAVCEVARQLLALDLKAREAATRSRAEIDEIDKQRAAAVLERNEVEARSDKLHDQIDSIADALGDDTVWSNTNDRGKNAIELAVAVVGERDGVRKRLEAVCTRVVGIAVAHVGVADLTIGLHLDPGMKMALEIDVAIDKIEQSLERSANDVVRSASNALRVQAEVDRLRNEGAAAREALQREQAHSSRMREDLSAVTLERDRLKAELVTARDELETWSGVAVACRDNYNHVITKLAQRFEVVLPADRHPEVVVRELALRFERALQDAEDEGESGVAMAADHAAALSAIREDLCATLGESRAMPLSEAAGRVRSLTMRISDIANEAFGLFPVKSSDELLTEIERGITHQRFRINELERPVPMRIHCPLCGTQHVDEGEFATRPHKSHTCQNKTCGLTWKVADAPTVGVRFLPDTENAPDNVKTEEPSK